MAKKVLVAGGAGYIGSHCVLELLQIGYHPVVIDNFHNAIQGEGGVPESLRRVEEIVGKKIDFEKVDVLDAAALDRLFNKIPLTKVLYRNALGF